MKRTSGFSIVEFIFFLCIVGILAFLAIPFWRSLSLHLHKAERPDSQALHVDENKEGNLAFPPLYGEESNQTKSLISSD